MGTRKALSREDFIKKATKHQLVYVDISYTALPRKNDGSIVMTVGLVMEYKILHEELIYVLSETICPIDRPNLQSRLLEDLKKMGDVVLLGQDIVM